MSQGARPWAVTVSVLLHAALIGVLWWAARHVQAPLPKVESPPLAIELWSGAAAPKVHTTPAPVAPPPRAVAPPPAEVNLGTQEPVKAKPKKQPPPQPKPEPPKPKLKEPPKPEPKAKETPKPKPVEAHKKAPDSPSQKQKPHAAADDLLADLGPPAARPGKDKTTQAGAAQGVEGGSSKGSGSVVGYETRVRQKVLPLVRLPDSLNGNPMAVVRVSLFPTLAVRSVTLAKSSGNTDYDNAVLSAVKEAGTFPALLPGLTFEDVRSMTLRFRPQD
jgi:colicin import membrane protein